MSLSVKAIKATGVVVATDASAGLVERNKLLLFLQSNEAGSIELVSTYLVASWWRPKTELKDE